MEAFSINLLLWKILNEKILFSTSYNDNGNVKVKVIPDTKNVQRQTAYLDQLVDQIHLWYKQEHVNFTEKGTRR